MPTLYDWAFHNPELVPLYIAFALVATAWVYWSSRKLFTWGASIASGYDRGEVLPPDHLTNEIALFLVVIAADLLLFGAYVYAITP